MDPVDGTNNFVHGSPDYAVMVAELRRGEVVRSWILQPEHDVTFVAERGAGAWRNGVRMPLLDPRPDVERWRGTAMQPLLRNRKLGDLPRIGVTRSCAGVDYSLVACGKLDFVVFAHSKVWDHAPGALLVSEVGGATVSESGARYQSIHSDRWLLCAASIGMAQGVSERIGRELSPIDAR